MQAQHLVEIGAQPLVGDPGKLLAQLPDHPFLAAVEECETLGKALDCNELVVEAPDGVARLAAERNGGGVVRADSRRLPLADATVDAVTAIWLLHLLRGDGDVEAVVAEAARVLTTGGVFVTTVDKTAGHDVGSDIDVLLAPHRAALGAADSAGSVEEYGARHGLRTVGEAWFTGHGQGRSPAGLASEVRSGHFRSPGMSPEATEQLAAAMEALPEPCRRRPDPEFRLVALKRSHTGQHADRPPRA